MRIKNSTSLDNDLVRRIVNFVKPSGISNFDVMLKNSKESNYTGRAYCKGSSYHERKCWFVVVRVGHRQRGFYQPYQYGQLKGKRYWYASRLELVVLVMAHELRHLWQAKHSRGKFWGSRGRYSEIDTDSYAIQKLRQWRKAEQS